MAGKQWDRNRVGPRFPAPGSYEDIADPANGEKVRRCWSCGTPSTSEKILMFGLTMYGKSVGQWALCERCWLLRNPRDPRDGDPLRAA